MTAVSRGGSYRGSGITNTQGERHRVGKLPLRRRKLIEQSLATSTEQQISRAMMSETPQFSQTEGEYERESRPGRGRQSGGFRRRGRMRQRAPRFCTFCRNKVTNVDYKRVDVLQPYVTARGKIRPRRQTGLCAKHQRRVARAIKRARHLALIPYTTAGHGRFPS
jgi:small subunit ribosomal protein S18